MTKTFVFGATFALALTAIGAASQLVYVARTTAAPCDRQFVNAHTINPPPQTSPYYAAQDCETIFADHLSVLLPPLTGATLPLTVTVYNVGSTTVVVGARGPQDVIKARVYHYSTPSENWLPLDTPELCCAEGSLYYLPMGTVATFEAMPDRLRNSWFVR